jgi:hypothetical protein
MLSAPLSRVWVGTISGQPVRDRPELKPLHARRFRERLRAMATRPPPSSVSVGGSGTACGPSGSTRPATFAPATLMPNANGSIVTLPLVSVRITENTPSPSGGPRRFPKFTPVVKSSAPPRQVREALPRPHVAGVKSREVRDELRLGIRRRRHRARRRETPRFLRNCVGCGSPQQAQCLLLPPGPLPGLTAIGD